MRLRIALISIIAALLVPLAAAQSSGSGNPTAKCAGSVLNTYYVDVVNNQSWACTTAGWRSGVGFGSPTAISLACSPLNYGNNYTDLTGNNGWFCSTGGWQQGSGSSYVLPAATSSILGGVKPDGTTIANAAGAIKVAIPNCISAVANLGACPSLQTGSTATVTDGASISDCTVGGGSTLVACQYNGASWAAVFPGSLTVAGTQYAIQTNNGSGGLAGINSPTTNGFYTCGYNVTASVAVLLGCTQPGIAIDASNPATLLYNDRAAYLNWTSGTALALPAQSGQFASNFPFVLQNTAGATLTITPNAGASNLIDGGATGALLPNFAAFVYSDGSINWNTIKIPTFAAFPACTNIYQFSTSTGFNCPARPPVNLGVTNVTPAADSTSAASVTSQTTGTNDFVVDTTNHRVGVGGAGAAPVNTLDVGGGKFEVSSVGACPVIDGFTMSAPGCTGILANAPPTGFTGFNSTVGATTLVGSTASTHWYILHWSLIQATVGVGCSTPTTFAVNIIVVDPAASGASTVPLIPSGTVSSTITITTNGAAGAQLGTGEYTWAQKSSQTPQVSVTPFTAGSCTTVPTITFNPVTMLVK